MKRKPLRRVSPRNANIAHDKADKELLLNKNMPRCAICGSIYYLELHHIFSKKAFPHLRHHEANHLLVCRRHHALIHDKPAVGRLLIVGVIGADAFLSFEKLAHQRKSGRGLA